MTAVSLSGRLDDVPLQDVIQFLHVNARSGTLILRRAVESASILFDQGNIVSAFAPNHRPLGAILIQQGIVTDADLTAMIQRQRDESSAFQAWNMKADKRPLGTILLEEGLVTHEQLRAAIKKQIEETIYELVTWRNGEFEFVAGGVSAPDDLVIAPEEVLPSGAINTQFLLMEALRLLDERTHDEQKRGAGGDLAVIPVAAPAPEPARQKKPLVVLVTAEEMVRNTLRRAFEDMGYLVAETTDPATAKLWLADGVARGQNLVALVDLDLPAGGDDPQPGQRLALALAWAYPEALLMCFSEQAPADQMHELYRAGVRAVLPGPSAWGAEREADAQELAMSALCVASLANPQGVDAAGGMRRWLDQLRFALGQVRESPHISTISLALMQVIAENVDRAVLFVVRPLEGDLVGMGAFGTSSGGEDLAETTRNLTLRGPAWEALRVCMDQQMPVRGRCDGPGWPTPLFEVIGFPKNREAVLVPVVGNDQVVCVIYADNGARQAPIRDLELIDFAAHQVGMALDNARLREAQRPPRRAGGAG